MDVRTMQPNRDNTSKTNTKHTAEAVHDNN